MAPDCKKRLQKPTTSNAFESRTSRELLSGLSDEVWKEPIVLVRLGVFKFLDNVLTICLFVLCFSLFIGGVHSLGLGNKKVAYVQMRILAYRREC